MIGKNISNKNWNLTVDIFVWVIVVLMALALGIMKGYKMSETDVNEFLVSEFYNVTYERCLLRCEAYQDVQIAYKGSSVNIFDRKMLTEPEIFFNYTQG